MSVFEISRVDCTTYTTSEESTSTWTRTSNIEESQLKYRRGTPKGKQGTKGQKQITEENKQTLNFYLYIILGVNVVYFLAQYFIFSESFTAKIIVLSVLAVGTHLGCYKFLSSIAGSGIDLNMKEGMADQRASKGQRDKRKETEENKQTLNFYLYIILGVNVVYFLAQYFIFSESFTAKIIVLSVLAVGTHLGCYKFLSSIAGSGIDLNMKEGMAEHAKDVLLLTAIVQGLALISNYFWLLWLIPKGKQGTKGQKQITEENKQTLNFYLYIILGVNVVYFLAQYFIFSESFTAKIIVLSVLAVGTHLGCYKFLSSIAGSGIDLNMKEGMAEHAKDVLLLTAIVQGLALISNYFWLLWLIAPGYAFYLLWVNILGPWFFAEAPEVDDKKQKKMDRKMRRH